VNDQPSSADPGSDLEGPPARPDKRIKLVVIVVLLVVVAYVGGNGMKNAWAMQRKIECSRNMRAVAAALTNYYETLPASIAAPPVSADLLKELIASGAIERKRTLCPVANPTESNYVIANPVSVLLDGNTAPYLWEPLANHDGEGANVYFFDGHTEFVKPKEYSDIISKVSPTE
jgi:prepilin-type processing-associated H-X9-DG protein